MNQNFSNFITAQIAALGWNQREAAARMGLSASQLCKVLRGQHVERETASRIIAGISDEPKVQAECLASFLRDLLPLAGTAAARILIRVR